MCVTLALPARTCNQPELVLVVLCIFSCLPLCPQLSSLLVPIIYHHSPCLSPSPLWISKLIRPYAVSLICHRTLSPLPSLSLVCCLSRIFYMSSALRERIDCPLGLFVSIFWVIVITLVSSPHVCIYLARPLWSQHTSLCSWHIFFFSSSHLSPSHNCCLRENKEDELVQRMYVAGWWVCVS